MNFIKIVVIAYATKYIMLAWEIARYCSVEEKMLLFEASDSSAEFDVIISEYTVEGWAEIGIASFVVR